MDLESECRVLESVEDIEEIKNLATPCKLWNSRESKVQSNGSYAVENNDNSKLEVSSSHEVMENGSDVSGHLNSHRMEMKSEVSPSPPTASKGHGLKKWRRIRRDLSKGGESGIYSEDLSPQVSNSGVSSSKRVQFYAERYPKSEGSASSMNAMVRSLDGYAFLGYTAVSVGPSFAAGTDSENSEDRSSKSSIAAGAPKMKYERPVIVGYAHGKSTMRTSSGKNSTHSVQHGEQGKSRTETTKKARGERVKIEKENSQLSLESDSRSSSFVFVQGNYSTSNGIQSERPVDYGDEVHGSEHLDRDGFRCGYVRDGEEGHGGISPESVVTDSSWVGKEELTNNHSSSTYLDPLADSTLALQSVQEALEKELLKLKEMGIDNEKMLQETSSEQFLSSEVVETVDKDMEIELDIFRQKIEAEVEYLAISRTIRTLRINISDQLTLSEDQKALASGQTQILDKLGDTENKAAMLKKEAEKLENICEDIASADETLKLQNGVCKYTSCFFMQLVIFVVVIGVFISKLPPSFLELVPT